MIPAGVVRAGAAPSNTATGMIWAISRPPWVFSGCDIAKLVTPEPFETRAAVVSIAGAPDAASCEAGSRSSALTPRPLA